MHNRIPKRVLAAACACVCALMQACQTMPAQPSADVGSALEAYDNGDYVEALERAERAHRRERGLDREGAALIAGLAAYELDRYAEARRWLAPLLDSRDSEIAGRAAGGLGLIEVERGDYAAAVKHLDMAGRKLGGDDAARANYYAGQCYELLGRTSAATLAYRLARSTAQDPDLRERIEARLGEGGYSVQVGAFASMENAERRRGWAAARARAMGLDPPRIERTTDATGRTLFAVRIGSYGTLREAEAARVRIGGDSVVIRKE